MSTNHTDIIKDKLSILDVVSSYVKLEKAGKSWKGKSPFTNEKTPSFYVSPDKGFFYCFSSGKGGDVFTFIQEIERVEFREALKMLADRAGVDLGASTGQSIESKLLKLMDDTTKWYEVNLRKDKEVVDYLVGRGLTKDTIIRFRIGYAKHQWSDLYDYLKKKGYQDDHIEQAGLSVKRDKGGYYDRFRSRIMFPIMNSRGKVIGFSGRIFGSGDDGKAAKYVNSPEGVLFDKSQVLYGYHSAKNVIAKEGFCVLVEGQFDVILAQQAGSINTVAVSGTGLTDGHIEMIKRFADTVLLCFDSDKAGIKATRRSALKAYEYGLKAKVVVLPVGQDPADIIKQSEAQWGVYIADSKEYISYRLEVFLEQNPSASFEDRHSLVKEEIFDFLHLTESSVLRERLLQDLARFLGVGLESVKSDFEGSSPSNDIQELQGKVPEPTYQQREHEPKRYDQDSIKQEVLGLVRYLQQYHKDDWSKKKSDPEMWFDEIFKQTLNEAQNDLDKSVTAMLSFKNEELLKDQGFIKIYNQLSFTLKHELLRKLRSQSQDLLGEIRLAEHTKTDDQLLLLQKQHQELLVRIDGLTHHLS